MGYEIGKVAKENRYISKIERYAKKRGREKSSTARRDDRYDNAAAEIGAV